MNVEKRIRRLIDIANHIDPSIEPEPIKTCKICKHLVLYPYRSKTPRIDLDGDYHWICIYAKRDNSYDIVNDMYFTKDSNDNMRNVFE